MTSARIHVGWPDNDVIRLQSRGQHTMMPIYWQIDAKYYPCYLWDDFVIIVVGWWLVSTTKLWEGSSFEELDFMDGPYSVRAYRNSGGSIVEFTARGSNIQWRSSMGDFTD
jgi:hypothetical protein